MDFCCNCDVFCCACCICDPCSFCCCYGFFPTPEYPGQTCFSALIGCLTCGAILYTYEKEKPTQIPIPLNKIKSEFMSSLQPQFIPNQQNGGNGYQQQPQIMTAPMMSTIEIISVQIPVQYPAGTTFSVQRNDGQIVIFQAPVGTIPGSIIQIQSQW
jgi:hypothetical protein